MATFAETSGHAGDERNFEALYETYKSDVQRLASYLLRNATDAEDAAQTVFLNVLRALRQGVTPTDPRAWLLAITRNVCFSRKRALSARPVQVELEAEHAYAEPDPDSGPSADEIVGALARLLPNQRTALILRDFRGVSRPEICSLMVLTPVALEALLTRARAAFREELEAGEQPFACDETRVLVEQQLDGLITVADRHSLRTHLRHCASCSTLARAVRSSRGKLAALLFWPSGLISRLVAAFSQSPTAVHVAAALTSSAAVATIAIPVAVSTGPSAAHIEGRTPPGAVAAVVRPARIALPSLPTLSGLAGAAASVVHATPAKHAATHASSPAHRKATHPVAAHHVSHATTTQPSSRSSSASSSSGSSTTLPSTTASSGITTPAQQPASSGTAAPVQHAAITTPASGTPTRSASPIVRPSAKPKPKPNVKPAKKSTRKKHVRHDSGPVQQAPASSAPAASIAPADGGAVNGAGSGTEIGAPTSPAIVPSSSNSGGNGASTGSSATSSSTGSGSGGNGGSDGNGDHHKHKK